MDQCSSEQEGSGCTQRPYLKCIECQETGYFKDGRCQRCNESPHSHMRNCKKCDSDSTCTQCMDGNDFQDGYCCPTGHYLSYFGQCLDCAREFPNCKLCNKRECTQCVDGYSPSNAFCCPIGQFNNGGTCNDCSDFHMNCKLCASKMQCSECIDGNFEMQDGKCKEQCTTGQYRHDQSLRCSNCLEGCKTCAGPDTCSECFNGYGLISDNGRCKKECSET